MALYLISYDINEKDAFDYEDLWSALGKIGATRILYSEWVIPKPEGEARNIYDELAVFTQQKDRLLVQEVARDAHFDKLLISDEKFGKLLEHARG